MYIDFSSLMMRFWSLVDFVPFLPLIVAQTKLNHDYRCTYGSPCWPSEQDFNSLASILSQPLVHPVPPASACYPVSDPSGNCSQVTNLWLDSNWRADQSGAYENINFETYMHKNGTISACYLNTTLGQPCEQGSIPPIGVDARTVEDVQAAVRFAARHSLRLVVKNTGHDYLGRSAGRGAFMIWTHNLKNITYNANFIPDSGPSSSVPALTLGAGVQWGEAYAAATSNNRFLVGGLSTGMSVGSSGGWIQGGGHSAFSASYGLGVDNVIQFTIVSPSGSHLTVSAFNFHSDLFWALRGGGAGSWGVITSVTYKTHDPVPIIMTGLNITIPDPETMAVPIIEEFIRLHPYLSDLGWGGYSGFSNSSLMAFWVAPNVSWAQANETIQPFYNFIKNVTGNPDAVTFSLPFNNFAQWVNFTFGAVESQSQVGVNVELASRLLSRDAASGDRARDTAKLLLDMDGVSINFICGGAVSRIDPDSTGLNPGWRKAIGLVYTIGVWKEGDSVEAIRGVRQQLVNDIDHLDPISPDSATYMNEASLYEPDFKKSFFGSHYDNPVSRWSQVLRTGFK